MLSVLIPTYGYPVLDLSLALHSQLLASGVPFELICLDNGSGSDINAVNEGINELEFCHFTALQEDGGRSRIRNKLASQAKYPWLLFLDADVLPVKEDFIERYLSVANSGVSIAFGGLEYQSEQPDKISMLRWVYGKKREAVPLEKRRKDAVHTFTSANFIISKKLMVENPFEESLMQYGFEDALLAIALDRKGVKIHHLDNPVYHLGLDTSAVFLEKTRKAVQNLWFLHQKGYISASDSNLLEWSLKLERFGVRGLAEGAFKILKPLLESNLTSGNPSMLVFDLYRLGYLSGLTKGS